MPALLTSASSRPKRRSTVAIAAATAVGIGDVAMQRQRIVGVGQRRDRAVQQFALDVEQRHAPALGEKPFCRRKPDAARGAGDECDFLRGGVMGGPSRLIDCAAIAHAVRRVSRCGMIRIARALPSLAAARVRLARTGVLP